MILGQLIQIKENNLDTQQSSFEGQSYCEGPIPVNSTKGLNSKRY
jgi:hypothetical protein